jgi:hypothetical protein
MGVIKYVVRPSVSCGLRFGANADARQPPRNDRNAGFEESTDNIHTPCCNTVTIRVARPYDVVKTASQHSEKWFSDGLNGSVVCANAWEVTIAMSSKQDGIEIAEETLPYEVAETAPLCFEKWFSDGA